MKLSVVLPVHNEAKIIKSTFDEIYKKVRLSELDSEFILVENGSTDSSLDVLSKISKSVRSTRVIVAPKGYGSAILAGIKIAKGDYISYLPSDGQVDMNVFAGLWKLAQKDRWEIVKVKRVGRENLGRTIVTLAFSLIMALVFGTKIIDVNGSPRILKRHNVNRLHLKSTDSFLDGEMLIKAARGSWTIKEVPMRNLERIGGKSTRSLSTFLEFFSNIYKWRIGKA